MSQWRVATAGIPLATISISTTGAPPSVSPSAAVTLGACTLGLSLVSVPAAQAHSVQPLAPQSERAPESDQFSVEGVTTVGELRTVNGALSHARDGRSQIIRHLIYGSEP